MWVVCTWDLSWLHNQHFSCYARLHLEDPLVTDGTDTAGCKMSPQEGKLDQGHKCGVSSWHEEWTVGEKCVEMAIWKYQQKRWLCISAFVGDSWFRHKMKDMKRTSSSSFLFVNSLTGIYLIFTVIMLLRPFRNAILFFFCAGLFLRTAELEDVSRRSHSARVPIT